MTKAKTETVTAMPTQQEDGRTWLQIDLIHPDKNQPRQTFDQEKLQELAKSIEQQGILQDLLVQQLPPLFKLREPDLTCPDWQVVNLATKEVEFNGLEHTARMYAGEENLRNRYVIIDGERRWRAAKIAGHSRVPVQIRSVDEKQKLAIQVTANQQRENLTALEEAAAFQKEIESGRHTADSLHKAMGVSRATVFSRLALNRLSDPTRQAVLAGKISVSVAGLVAMVPQADRQAELLKTLTDEECWRYPYSFREAQELIEEEYVAQLKGAPFDLKAVYDGEVKRKSGTILSLHGRGSCADCKARTGNLKDLFPDYKNPNVCLEPDCYQAKCTAHFRAEAQKQAEKTKATVIQAEVFAKSEKDYVRAEESKYDYSTRGFTTYKKMLAKQKVKPAIAITPRGLVEVFPKEEAKEAVKAAGYDLTGKQKAAATKEEKQLAEENTKRVREIEAQLFKELKQHLDKLPTDVKSEQAFWQMLLDQQLDDYEVGGVLEHLGLDGNVEKATKAMKMQERRSLVMITLMLPDGSRDVTYGDGANLTQQFENLADLAGFDAKRRRQEIEKELKASAAIAVKEAVPTTIKPKKGKK